MLGSFLCAAPTPAAATTPATPAAALQALLPLAARAHPGRSRMGPALSDDRIPFDALGHLQAWGRA